jgi:hypothetical protein
MRMRLTPDQLNQFRLYRQRGWTAQQAFRAAHSWRPPQVTSRGYGDSRDTWRYADDFGGMARSW